MIGILLGQQSEIPTQMMTIEAISRPDALTLSERVDEVVEIDEEMMNVPTHPMTNFLVRLAAPRRVTSMTEATDPMVETCVSETAVTAVYQTTMIEATNQAGMVTDLIGTMTMIMVTDIDVRIVLVIVTETETGREIETGTGTDPEKRTETVTGIVTATVTAIAIETEATDPMIIILLVERTTLIAEDIVPTESEIETDTTTTTVTDGTVTGIAEILTMMTATEIEIDQRRRVVSSLTQTRFPSISNRVRNITQLSSQL